MEEKSREQLEQEIASLEEEISAKKEELDQIKQGVMDAAGDQAQDSEPDEEMLARQAQVAEELSVLQARMVALQRQLNDAISNEAMKSMNEED